MKKKYKLLLLAVLLMAVVAGAIILLRDSNFFILDTKGVIADEQKDLIVFTTLLMLVVVLPVFALTAFISWRYRESNSKSRYTPDWDHNKFIEITWWVFPGVIILFLAIITWNATHTLDPFRQIESPAKPITIQVTALQWKWLFIYPEHNIASVNYLQIPANTPVIFEVTADAPMNSFWIPQLGGQIYAMPGMKTKLHLMANNNGDYAGSSANISGRGFSGMTFSARASSEQDYQSWIHEAKKNPGNLTYEKYNQLSQPSLDNTREIFGIVESNLYSKIIAKYMAPALPSSGINSSSNHGGHSMNGIGE